jgi:hypothetical protein
MFWRSFRPKRAIETKPRRMKAALQAPGLFVYRKDARQWLERLKAPK